MTDIYIQIQQADFAGSDAIARLKHASRLTGAIVEFTGCVRADELDAGEVSAIELEHYPGMTEKAIEKIAAQACQRWDLQALTVIHRIGRLQAGDNIVYVGASSKHRKAALSAVDYVMDFLKNDVPLWKKEVTKAGEHWVEQKNTDVDAKKHWD